MRLKSDLLEVMLAVCDGTLEDVFLKWDPRPAVCVVMASGGYPGDYQKGKAITGLKEAEELDDVVVFHAGTQQRNGDVVTSGGRVLGVTALGTNVAAAKARAYEAVDRIHFDGAYYRHDIADKAIGGNGENGFLIHDLRFWMARLHTIYLDHDSYGAICEPDATAAPDSRRLADRLSWSSRCWRSAPAFGCIRPCRGSLRRRSAAC